MGKYEKLLKQWKENTPKEAKADDVLHLAERFGLKVIPPRSGSHYVIQDARLKQFGGKDILNEEMTLPVSGGKKVKGKYIKRLIDFLYFISEDVKDEQQD